jgi:outer membrane receptor protein involved in Fe transport
LTKPTTPSTPSSFPARAQAWLSETPQAIGVVNAATLERDKPKTMGDILNRIAGVLLE